MKIRSSATPMAAAVSAMLVVGLAPVAHASGIAVPITQAGAVVAWGNHATAATVPGPLADKLVVAIEASPNASLALADDGTVTAWGAEAAPEAYPPGDLADVQVLSAAQGSALALKSDGTVVPWGNSTDGITTLPPGLTDVIDVEAAGTHAYAVNGDGTVVEWGNNPIPSSVPETLTDVRTVDSGSYHALALKSDKTVEAWGTDIGGTIVVPPEIQGEVIDIAAGQMSSAAVTEDGKVHVWGALGAAAQPAGLADEVAIEVDVSTNVVARTASGKVFTWGGSNATLNSLPGSLATEQVAAIAAGQNHVLALVTTFHAVDKPSIDGSAVAGETLEATPASFSLEPDTVSNQWLADDEPIDDATGPELALDDTLVGKTITFATTAERGDDEVVSVSDPVGPVAEPTPETVDSTTTVAITPASAAYGAARTITVTVAKADGTPTGSVAVKIGSSTRNATLTAGKATLAVPGNLAVGTHAVSGSYAGDTTTNASSSAITNLVVTKAAAKAKVQKAKVNKKGTKVVVRVKVSTAAGVKADGKTRIVIKRGKKTVIKKNVRVNAKGIAKLTVKKFHKHVAKKAKKKVRGKYKVNAKYLGSASTSGNGAKGTFKV